VVTKKSVRPPTPAATGPGCTPHCRIIPRAAVPAAAGTSRTSNTRPVARITLASGRSSQHRPASSGSEVASICQAAEIGWAPGAGQPTRSQEHARPVPWSRIGAAGRKDRLRDAADVPAPSVMQWAPAHTGQPMAA
jgi:hypothetical protein